jgi:hypothetical protein
VADRTPALQPCRLLAAFLTTLLTLTGATEVATAQTGRPTQGLGGLLSAPMPGTQAREVAETAARVEAMLSGFDGVTSAAVIVSPPSDAEASPDVGVQLALEQDFEPTLTWLDAICAFALRTVPRLDRSSLTVVDSTGRILYDSGEAHLPPTAAALPETGVIDSTFHFEPWWLWVAGGLGFLLVVAAMAAQLLLRDEPEVIEPEHEPGPLDFLEDVPEEQLATALAQEREELVAAVLALAPEPLATRLHEREELTCAPLARIGPPDAMITAALASALRERLARV